MQSSRQPVRCTSLLASRGTSAGSAGSVAPRGRHGEPACSSAFHQTSFIGIQSRFHFHFDLLWPMTFFLLSSHEQVVFTVRTFTKYASYLNYYFCLAHSVWELVVRPTGDCRLRSCAGGSGAAVHAVDRLPGTALCWAPTSTTCILVLLILGLNYF